MVEGLTVVPDRTDWALRNLERPNTLILDKNIALRANSVLGDLPNNYSLGSLIAPWDSYSLQFFLTDAQRQLRKERRLTWGDVDFEKPSEEWQDFMKSLTEKQLGRFNYALSNAIYFHKARDVGRMRELTEVRERLLTMGTPTKSFLYVAFKQHEHPEELTLGL